MKNGFAPIADTNTKNNGYNKRLTLAVGLFWHYIVEKLREIASNLLTDGGIGAILISYVYLYER